ATASRSTPIRKIASKNSRTSISERQAENFQQVEYCVKASICIWRKPFTFSTRKQRSEKNFLKDLQRFVRRLSPFLCRTRMLLLVSVMGSRLPRTAIQILKQMKRRTGLCLDHNMLCHQAALPLPILPTNTGSGQ